MRHLQILAVYPNISDPTSFYRGAGPFGALRKQYRDRVDLMIHTPQQIGWADLVDMDMVFMQRPCVKSHATVAEIAHRCHVPIWVDYDDDLLAIEDDNQNYDAYSSDESVESIETVIGMADAITVSTPALSKRMFPMAVDATARKVVPNAWNDFLFTEGWKSNVGNAKNILWRGTSTHIEDLLVHKSDILAVASEYPDWHWTFLGMRPWFLTREIPNSSHVKAKDILLYLKALEDSKSSIMIVPLADTDFNRAKSMISWLEGTYAGAAVLGPGFDEWKRPGIGNYQPGHFAEELRAIIKSKEVRMQMVQYSRQHIDDQLLLSKVNQQRLDVFDELGLL